MPSPLFSVSSVRQQLRLGLLRELGRLASPRPVGAVPKDARVLVIRPDHIGDVLLTTPALALLRAALPAAYLAVLVGPWSAEIARRGPPLQALSTCEFPGFTRRNARWIGQPYLELRRAESLRRQRFDVAIVARPDHWWGALLAMLAGIPHRIGFNVPECAPFLTDALELPGGAHTAELSLLLANRLCELAGVESPKSEGRPIFNVADHERREALDAIQACFGAASGPLMVLHPGAGAELKLWPPERWAQVLDQARKRWQARTLIVAPRGEQALADAIVRSSETKVQCIPTDRGLGFLAAVLEHAQVVLGSDSGPLHLATALGVPTVRLFGPTDPAEFGPWPVGDQQVALRALVPCSPCGHVQAPPCGAVIHPRCMMEHSPASVLEAISWILDAPESGFTPSGTDLCT
ncbi:MAG: glycosyltransferase family 9 protein [Chloroflexota bacterium]